MAPLVVLVGGQRDARVEHRGHHVDERNLRQDHVIPVGCHVRDGAHQQAAGAAAMGGDSVGRGVAFLTRWSVTSMKSVKVFFLRSSLPSSYPRDRKSVV